MDNDNWGIEVTPGPDPGSILILWEWDGSPVTYFTINRAGPDDSGESPAPPYPPLAVVAAHPGDTCFSYEDVPNRPGVYFYTVTAYATSTSGVSGSRTQEGRRGRESVSIELSPPSNLSAGPGPLSGDVNFKWSDGDTTVGQYLIWRTPLSQNQPATCPVPGTNPSTVGYQQIDAVQDVAGISSYQDTNHTGSPGDWACYTVQAVGTGGSPIVTATRGVPGQAKS